MAENTQQMKTMTTAQDRRRMSGLFGVILLLGFLANQSVWAEMSVGEIRARGTVYTAEDFIEEEAAVEELKEKKDWKPFGMFKREPGRAGYLISSSPIAIRFSDDELKNQRTPLPALPEYSILSNRYDPYLIEEPLPEDELRKNRHLEQLVVNLDPHSVISGKIDFSSGGDEFHSADVLLEESKTMALRADEVLIFFETDVLGSKGNNGTPQANVLVPFNPATTAPLTVPHSTTTKSSATYTIDD